MLQVMHRISLGRVMPIATCLPVENPGLLCTAVLLVSVVVFKIKQRNVRKVSTTVSQVDSFSIFKMAVENTRNI
jgi:hypothetical protein